MVFTFMEAALKTGKVKMVGGVFRFDLKGPKGTTSTVVDLKTAPGSLTRGAGKADCTLAMAENDYVDLVNGKTTGMKAFMQGKLKIKGNMGLAQKFTPTVFNGAVPDVMAQIAAGGGGGAAAAAGGPALESQALFDQMAAAAAAGGAKLIGAVFQFDIKRSDGVVVPWTIDLKNGTGSVAPGKAAKPDTTFAISDADFVALSTGKLTGMKAFMQGKMKIKGNMGLAQKFNPNLFTAKL